jgi:hypothetical protein
VPPGYDGPLPQGGFFIARAKTFHVIVVRPRVPGEQERSQARRRNDP